MAAAVENRIEVWVVIHLHLAVELKAPFPVQNLLPKGVEAGGKIVALVFENEQSLEVAGAMLLGG